MSNARQTVIDAIVARLKTITTAGGYNLAIGTKVYDWRMSPLKPADLPAIEVRDGKATVEILNCDGDRSHRMMVNIVVMASGTSSAATVRKGIQDISRAMYADRLLGGLLKEAELTETDLDMQQDENLLAAGQCSYSLLYYTDANNI